MLTSFLAIFPSAMVAKCECFNFVDDTKFMKNGIHLYLQYNRMKI